MRKNEIKNIAGELLLAVPSSYRPIRAYVYGSRARGDAAPMSDLDILIELGEPVNRKIKNIVRDKAWELSLKYEFVISTAVVSEEQFEHGPLAESGFVQNVRKDGVEVAA